MSERFFKFSTQTWVAAIGLLAVLSTLAVVAGATSNYMGKDRAAAATAWYAEAPPPATSASTNAATPGTEKAGAVTDAARSMSRAFHEAAAKVAPAVVMITNSPAMASAAEDAKPQEKSDEMPFGFKGMPFGNLPDSPEFHQFFKEFHSGPMQPHAAVGVGSGVIVDPSGIVLTNNHVVAGGGQITVRLADGREFKGVDVKTDPKSDLAILRIRGAGSLPAARLGNSDQMEVGDWVLALGQPFGLEGTVTAGIISAKGRGIGITDREDFLQTDAAINPGNSGGPLVNLDGEVIGINTAISTNNGGYQGVGFAIPINLAKWVGGQLETAGKVQRAYLGVAIQPVTQPLAEQFKAKVHTGVLVTEVRDGTPAAKAGLKPGDIILRFAGKPVSSPHELQGVVEEARIGSSQSLTVLRDGKQISLSVTCREMPADFTTANMRSPAPGKTEPSASRFEKLGIEAEDLTPRVAEHLGVKVEHGVAITDVRAGSPADLAGLAAGMVITQADRQAVASVGDLHKVLDARPLNQGVLLLVHSQGGSRFVVIRVESE